MLCGKGLSFIYFKSDKVDLVGCLERINCTSARAHRLSIDYKPKLKQYHLRGLVNSEPVLVYVCHAVIIAAVFSYKLFIIPTINRIKHQQQVTTMGVMFWFSLYAALFEVCYGLGSNSSEGLYNLIISNHNKNIRPCVECDRPLQMNLTFYITSLNELHEVKGEIVTIGYIVVAWIDERINWRPTNYNNLTSMIMPSKEVWHPKLIVGNPSRKLSTLNEDVAHVRVFYTGSMSWMPGDIFYTKCYPDIFYYPFDRQSCCISILPWGFPPSEIVLNSTNPSVFAPHYQDNGEWILVNIWSEDVVDSRVSFIRFCFTFKRRSEFLVSNIILPIVFLNFLNALIFLIPTVSGERVSCAVTVLLSFAVFISVVGDTIPKTSDPVPLIVYYLIAVFSGSAVNMVCTILSVHIYYRDPAIPVTGIYRALVVWTCKTRRRKTRTEIKVGTLYCNDENGKNSQSKEAEWTGQEKEDVSWMRVSKCLDNVCLFLSIVHFITCTVVQLLIVPNLTKYAWYSLKEEFDALETHMQTESAESSVQTWLVYSGIATVFTVVILLILLVLRKRIGLVIQLYVEAGRAIGRMPLLVLFPIWTLLLLIVCVAALCLIAVFIETSGLPVVNPINGHVKYEFEKFWVYLRWYNLFAIIWVSAFIVACQDLAIAGAVAKWYFTRDRKNLGNPLLQSIKNLIRYHLGSVAFGSLIIALVRLVRLILGYVQKKLKGKVGKVVDFILKCLQCCLWCFDKFLCYLNRNAYIEIAIYGYNFCSSAKKAFLLIVANCLRVAAINSIGDFVLFLGKLSTAAIVMVIGNVAFFSDREDIVYRWVPISVSCMFAFAISHCFLLVYEITIDTIFLCFCEDCERNDGVTRPYYMSKNLMKYLDDSAKAALEKEQASPSNKKHQKTTKV